MTTTEKLNYIIQTLKEITEQAKTIGEMSDYTIGANDANAFIGLYNSVLGLTEKISLEELINTLETNAFQSHTHAMDDVNNLDDALSPYFTDGSGNVWKVDRNAANYDYTSLLQYDKISGFQDHTTNKKIWVEGIILNATITLPADLTDNSKFFQTLKKVRL